MAGEPIVCGGFEPSDSFVRPVQRGPGRCDVVSGVVEVAEVFADPDGAGDHLLRLLRLTLLREQQRTDAREAPAFVARMPAQILVNDSSSIFETPDLYEHFRSDPIDEHRAHIAGDGLQD